MPGVGHGGPARGKRDLKRRLQESERHAMLLETHIEPPTDAERAAVRSMVARAAVDPEESAMFVSMLLGDDLA